MKTRSEARDHPRQPVLEEGAVADITEFLADCVDDDACGPYVLARHGDCLPALAQYLHERNDWSQ